MSAGYVFLPVLLPEASGPEDAVQICTFWIQPTTLPNFGGAEETPLPLCCCSAADGPGILRTPFQSRLWG